MPLKSRKKLTRAQPLNSCNSNSSLRNKENVDKELEIFEKMERKAAEESFCSTASTVAHFLNQKDSSPSISFEEESLRIAEEVLKRLQSERSRESAFENDIQVCLSRLVSTTLSTQAVEAELVEMRKKLQQGLHFNLQVKEKLEKDMAEFEKYKLKELGEIEKQRKKIVNEHRDKFEEKYKNGEKIIEELKIKILELEHDLEEKSEMLKRKEKENSKISRLTVQMTDNLSPPSSNDRICYENGDVLDLTKVSEGITEYFYASQGVTETNYLEEGKKVYFFKDGGMKTVYGDGKIETVTKEGVKQCFFPDGTLELEYEDKTKVKKTANGHEELIFPNGQTELLGPNFNMRTYPNGTQTILYKDGSLLTKYPNGATRLKDKDGNLIYHLNK